MNALEQLFGIGLEGQGLAWWQMASRGVLVFAFAIVLIRFGARRSLGESSLFDALLIIIIGSILSRAINGDAPLLPTMVTALGLMALHRVLAFVTFRSRKIGKVVKGEEALLLEDGRLLCDRMKKLLVTEDDLAEAVRRHAGVEDLSRVRAARLERSGDISVVLRSDR